MGNRYWDGSLLLGPTVGAEYAAARCSPDSHYSFDPWAHLASSPHRGKEPGCHQETRAVAVQAALGNGAAWTAKDLASTVEAKWSNSGGDQAMGMLDSGLCRNQEQTGPRQTSGLVNLQSY
jgi:hypothetical protein